MLSFALYLLKVIICSGILFGYYWLMLKNKIFHQYNRFYLLAAVLLSLSLPLIEINIFHNANQPLPQSIKLLQVVNGSQYLDDIFNTAGQTNFTTEQSLFILYAIVSFVFLSLFIQALARIRSLFIKHRHSLVENIFFINTTAAGTPFSFLKYIFWNDHIDPETVTGNQVFRHELAHVQQKHSYDKLFMNVILIVGWCNPFFWLIRKELNMIHEFVADKIAVEDSDTEAFAAMILQAAYPQHLFSLTNPFFYSPIKRRLIMLTKNRNPKVGYFGRLLVLPLAVLVFAAFTLKAKTFQHNIQSYNGKVLTVVVDAGHGGTDAGAISEQGKILEKDLNLAIVKKIKSLNTNSQIKILLTRETDLFQTPSEKVALAKKLNAELFISIHLSASPSPDDNANRGLNVWVPTNISGSTPGSQMIASALINEFNNNYELPVVQHPQQYPSTVRVLKDAECPAVLIEVGNITNAKDLAFLQTNTAQEAIAGKILAAIEKYAAAKDAKEKNGTVASTPVAVTNASSLKRDTVIPGLTLNKEKALIIVDGKTIPNSQLKTIRPETIESVNVYKDKEAIAQYGEKGKNGVVIITTKKKAISLNKIVEVKINRTDNVVQQQKEISNVIVVRNEKNPLVQPLYVIDGKIESPDYSIKSLSPNDIESINVLKGKSAIDKYGEKAINGVIEITMKVKEVIIKEIPISDASKKSASTKL
ncbi:MAG: hypothetical protein JWP81_4526 [Ferruginibacter sp.]|nr:hypothetical protein [Ferruginibacter sp.]